MGKIKIFGVTSFILLLIATIITTPAYAMTYFYVDPDWTSTKSGTSSQPWSRLDNAAWTLINTELNTDAVSVYFSARDASSDTDEVYTTKLNIMRSDSGSNRLILDGMSKYNTNDLAPIWSNYNGTSKAKISVSSGDAIAHSKEAAHKENQNYITIRGFKTRTNNDTRSGRIVFWGGDEWIIEYCHGGPIYVDYSTTGSGHKGNGITIRNNTITECPGEGIYIGGANNVNIDSHNNVTVENNIVYGLTSSTYGDGIDLKDRLTNLIVSGNTVYDNPLRGITSHSPGLFEKNKVYGNGTGYTNAGIILTASSMGSMDWSTESIIRNNVVYSNSGAGIYVYCGDWNITGTVYIYNNSVYNNGTTTQDNITTDGSKTISELIIKNNVSSNAATHEIDLNADTLSHTEDYNNFWGTVSGYTRGDNDINSDPKFVAANDLSLQFDSPCKDTGTSLSSEGFSDDYRGVSRPQVAPWDIGAYEWIFPAPQNLRRFVK